MTEHMARGSRAEVGGGGEGGVRGTLDREARGKIEKQDGGSRDSRHVCKGLKARVCLVCFIAC